MMGTERRPGMGVMIQMLGGNEETVDALESAAGRTIETASVEQEEGRYRPMGEASGDTLVLRFTDGTILHLWDGGQSCCEARYMKCDDDLQYFDGATFRDAQVRDAPEVEDKYGVHEIQFLLINTDKGSFQVANHNEHNGYYGGFWIKARFEEASHEGL